MKSVNLLRPAAGPLQVEPADLLRAPRRDRRPALTFAALSRSLSVLALSGCGVLAFAFARGPDPAPTSRPTAQAVVPAAKPAPAPSVPAALQPTRDSAQDARLVYGNPDALRAKPVEAKPAETRSVEVKPAESLPREPETTAAATPRPAAQDFAVAMAAPPSIEPQPAFASSAPVATPVSAPVAAAPAAEPAASEGIDLNTATLEALNGLNAGMIGRAIVRGRPYGAPEELVGRRILTRANFEKIKGRVVVGSAEPAR